MELLLSPHSTCRTATLARVPMPPPTTGPITLVSLRILRRPHLLVAPVPDSSCPQMTDATMHQDHKETFRTRLSDWQTSDHAQTQRCPMA